MNEFEGLCNYVIAHKGVFDNYEQAIIAFNKHKSRIKIQDRSQDTLKQFHDRYASKRRRKPHQNWYDFNEIKQFLKKNHLWGTQVFDTRNVCGDPTENIYYKDGICIDYAYSYDYMEVDGLNACDFIILEKAHNIKAEAYNNDDIDWDAYYDIDYSDNQ